MEVFIQSINVTTTELLRSDRAAGGDVESAVASLMNHYVPEAFTQGSGRYEPIYETQELTIATEPIPRTRRVEVGTREVEGKRRTVNWTANILVYTLVIGGLIAIAAATDS